MSDDATVQAREWLIPLRVVPADDMPLVVGRETDPETGETVSEGDTYYLQKGRTVSFVPITTMGTIFSTAGLMLSQSPPPGETEAEAQARTARTMKSMEELYIRLASVIAGWDIVDLTGQPRPDPYQNPDALLDLTQEELAWLVAQATGAKGAADRGKGSQRSRSGLKALPPHPQR